MLIWESDANDRNQDYLLFYQLTRITKDRGALAHDDVLEAVAGAVNYWTEQMSRDEDEAAEQYREEQLLKALQTFEGQVLGHQQAPSMWTEYH